MPNPRIAGATPMVDADRDIERWDTREVVLTAAKSYANPFRDVVLTADFTHSSGKVIAVNGFYDGGSTWRVRFPSAS